jgi:pimeloyl-ACP methyl ester carboxylesterase
MTSIHWRYRVGNQRDWIWRGWRIRYTYGRSQTLNENPPLLLVHGFGASIGHWRHNLTEFTQHHTVYALDLLGFGASEKVAAPYDTGFWAEQIYDFWRTFIGKPVVLVGNSIGSSVCLMAAAKYPEMVQGLVMINLPDSSVLEFPEWLSGAIALLKKVTFPVVSGVFFSPFVFNPLFRVIRSPKFVRYWASQAYGAPTALTEELLEILSRPAFDRGAAAALRAMVNSKSSSGEDFTAKTILPKLQIPILLIWGRADKMVPPKLAPLIAKLNSNLTLAELENAGHCPHDECPEVVNQLILEWLKEKKAVESQKMIAKVCNC